MDCGELLQQLDKFFSGAGVGRGNLRRTVLSPRWTKSHSRSSKSLYAYFLNAESLSADELMAVALLRLLGISKNGTNELAKVNRL